MFSATFDIDLSHICALLASNITQYLPCVPEMLYDEVDWPRISSQIMNYVDECVINSSLFTFDFFIRNTIIFDNPHRTKTYHSNFIV